MWFWKTQCLGSFALKATVCTAKVFSFFFNKGGILLKWEKCKDKDFNLAYGRWSCWKMEYGKVYLLCNYSCGQSFLVEILLVKLKNLSNSGCLNVDHGTAKQ